MNKRLSFNSMISDYEIVNPEFARVKVYVCYAGRNRNQSSISEEVLAEMSKTIYGIPVVAEYDQDNNCFKGHGGKLEITDDGIDFIQTTIPYGFVDPKTPVFYEEVTELDGMTKHNYLCVYAYLWYKRYPDVENVLRNQENKTIGQSMEIAVDSYEFDEENYCIIKGGHFSALAMLGVEPCFESAKVTSKFSKEDIELAYAEMIESFKKYTLETLSEDFVENTETNETEDFAEDEITVIEVEEEFVEDKDEEEEEEKDKDDKVEDKEDDIREEDDADEDDDEEKMAKKEDEEEKRKCELEAEVIELKAQLTDLQAEYEEIKTEYEALKSEYSTLELEVIELRNFKQEEELKAKEIALEENIFSKFEELKNVEGYAEIHALRFELDEKDLILRLKALAFDNNVIIGKKAKKEKQKVTKFSLDIKDAKKSSEWDILNLNKK